MSGHGKILGYDDGLKRRSAANFDTINTIPKAALEKKIAALSPRKVIEMADAIRFALGFQVVQKDMLDLEGMGRDDPTRS